MISRDVAGVASTIVWQGRKVEMRALHAADAERYAEFRASAFARRGASSANDDRLPDVAEYAARIADDRNVTIAAVLAHRATPKILGVVVATPRSDEAIADAAIALRPEVEGQGLGRLLMGMLIICCRGRGLRELRGEARVDQTRMRELARAFRFTETPSHAPGCVSLRLALHDTDGDA
jgi:acetyltransferase